MAITYVGADHEASTYTAPLFEQEQGPKRKLDLLWGDQVDTLETGSQRTRVRARGRLGWIPNERLGGPSLLEVYFIDVGQGDGVLIRTPDDRHVLIDGGWLRSRQPTGKNAADFVDWKFARDYRRDRIELDAMVVSHCDADHYGGLWDLINPEETDELDLDVVRVEAFFHAGVSWWRKPGGGRWLGPTADIDGVTHLTRLLGSRNTTKAAVEGTGPAELQGDWQAFLARVLTTRKRNNQPTPITRLSADTGYLPGFEPAAGQASILVLGPVTVMHQGQPAVRRLTAAPSLNTNGHSVLLRVDHGRARILLTGDLNKAAQRLLLENYEGRRQELAADVAKGCHHGSDDVSFEFLQTIRAAATVISSGDNEGHDHPQPSIVAASGLAGHLEPDGKDGIVTPLVYSTEISRSVKIGIPQSIEVPDPAGAERYERDTFDEVRVEYEETNSGDFNPTTKERTLDRTPIVGGLIYGLVNVRTDGDHILCATLSETDRSWNVRTFRSRF